MNNEFRKDIPYADKSAFTSKHKDDNVDMLYYESFYKNSGYNLVCGVDEAGRGPLAGPCVVAAVILDPNNMIEGLNDSKKLSEKKREMLYDEIIEKALAYNIVFSEKDEIDEINILNATLLSMKRAVEGLSIKPDIAMIDGNMLPEGMSVKSVAIIKGDAKSASIAAASILAKVTRDRHMVKLAEKYPQYGFEKHKGYGTKLHREMLLKYGPCDEHRRTFIKKVFSGGNS